MSTFANTKMLKSKYMNIFGLYFLLTSLQTLMELRFHSIYEGAHLLVLICPANYPKFAKVLICSPLGIFGQNQAKNESNLLGSGKE